MKHYQILWAISDHITHGKGNPFFLWGLGAVGILTFDTRQQARGYKKDRGWENAKVVKVKIKEM